MIADLLGQADRLAAASGTRPKQADLRRAISAAYYAVFHSLCKNCADTLVGTVKMQRPNRAWQQVYRGLDHKSARQACEAARTLGFPATIVSCADAFVSLQRQRHEADYDPTFKTTRAEARSALNLAKAAINDLRNSNSNDRKAFAVQLLFKKR
jgi:uncharacterized protein (UPF0332 family)